MKNMHVPKEQKEVLAHALRIEIDKVEAGGGDSYSCLSLKEAKSLLGALQKDGSDPIDLYLEKKCPVCGVDLVYELTRYCPQCGEEWYGQKVLKEFY